MSIHFSTGTQVGQAQNHVHVYRTSKFDVSASANSFQTIPDLGTSDLTMAVANSTIVYWFDLSTETDNANGHGIARTQYSTNSGSSWTTHQVFNHTGNQDNAVGTSCHGVHSPSLSAGQTYRLRVQYARTSSGGGNHAIADTGPGHSPIARLTVMALEPN